MKKKNLVGQKFGKLTVISEKIIDVRKDTRAYWECECECKNIIVVSTNHLTTGNTKSCGCLKTEAIIINQKLSLSIITKYKPHITSARKIWRQYCYQDNRCDLTFDQWFQISQKNCFYCGIGPSNKYNVFLKKKGASQEAKNNGDFIYNGLDRIDSTLSHTVDNVVPCCWICNRAKNTRTTEEFFQYINNLNANNVFIYPKLLILPLNYLLVSVKGAYRHYPRNYGTMEINLQTFYTFSQLPCFYCNAEKSNYFNVYLKDKKASQNAKDGAHFYYNGIDRLDSAKTHTINNIIPCCYSCNFAKSDLSLADFQAWIKRIQQFQKINK
jgi:hypothetical protein